MRCVLLYEWVRGTLRNERFAAGGGGGALWLVLEGKGYVGVGGGRFT